MALILLGPGDMHRGDAKRGKYFVVPETSNDVIRYLKACLTGFRNCAASLACRGAYGKTGLGQHHEFNGSNLEVQAKCF